MMGSEKFCLQVYDHYNNKIIIIIMFCLQWKEFQENVRHSYKEVKHKSIGGWEGISYPCHVYAKINFLF